MNAATTKPTAPRTELMKQITAPWQTGVHIGRLRQELFSIEVWDKWDERTRAFMMKVSIADHLTPKLAAALTDEQDSAGILHRLTGGRITWPLKFTGPQMAAMRLLCDGLSRNEIAGRMGITLYGVKSHMKLIYKKLDVPGGIEAVIKIKELGLFNE